MSPPAAWGCLGARVGRGLGPGPGLGTTRASPGMTPGPGLGAEPGLGTTRASPGMTPGPGLGAGPGHRRNITGCASTTRGTATRPSSARLPAQCRAREPWKGKGIYCGHSPPLLVRNNS